MKNCRPFCRLSINQAIAWLTHSALPSEAKAAMGPYLPARRGLVNETEAQGQGTGELAQHCAKTVGHARNGWNGFS
jgi:hypothetical protein